MSICYSWLKNATLQIKLSKFQKKICFDLGKRRFVYEYILLLLHLLLLFIFCTNLLYYILSFIIIFTLLFTAPCPFSLGVSYNFQFKWNNDMIILPYITTKNITSMLRKRRHKIKWVQDWRKGTPLQSIIHPKKSKQQKKNTKFSKMLEF
jgi:hypothetical protein